MMMMMYTLLMDGWMDDDGEGGKRVDDGRGGGKCEDG